MINAKPTGRPSREMQRLRHQQLLDAALDIVLEEGFDRATIDAVAARVGMTKRTIYARYADKGALFEAALMLAIENYALPPSELERIETDNLESALMRVATLRATLVSSPNGVRLNRILNAEALRYPHLLETFQRDSTGPAIDFVARLLRDATVAGKAAVDRPEEAATVFMSMVLGGATRQMLLGMPLSDRKLRERIAFAVRLFLDGARART